MQVLSFDEVYDKTKASYGRTALWTVGFGAIGAAVSGYNVTSTNDKIKADLNSKILKNGSLPKGVSTQGFLFFTVPKGLASLDGWKLNMTLKNPDHLTTILHQEFSGDVTPRKKSPKYGKKAKEKKIEK